MGCSHLTDIPCPWMGQGLNEGLGDFVFVAFGGIYVFFNELHCCSTRVLEMIVLPKFKPSFISLEHIMIFFKIQGFKNFHFNFTYFQSDIVYTFFHPLLRDEQEAQKEKLNLPKLRGMYKMKSPLFYCQSFCVIHRCQSLPSYVNKGTRTQQSFNLQWQCLVLTFRS